MHQKTKKVQRFALNAEKEELKPPCVSVGMWSQFWMCLCFCYHKEPDDADDPGNFSKVATAEETPSEKINK